MEQFKKKNLIYQILPLVSVSALILSWISFSLATGGIIFPGPASVVRRILKTFETPIAGMTIIGHTLISLKRVLTGLFISCVSGISIGILVGSNRYLKATLGSFLEIFRPIPPIAWIPIMIMWFGIGELPKILLIVLGSFFPVMLNTASGISLVNKINLDVGQIFGGNKISILKEIVLPTALPSIFSGIRTSVSCGWTVVLAAEMMGAQQGLGLLVMKGWGINDMALVLGAVIIIAFIGAMFSYLLKRAERLLMPWNR